MIDVVTIKASTHATRGSGVVFRSPGSLVLSGEPQRSGEGTVTFQEIVTADQVRWMSAELIGTFTDRSVRVRLGDGSGRLWYFDSSTGELEPVADTTQWDTEWSAADLLNNLDLWTYGTLIVVAHMIRVTDHRYPELIELRVLADFPTWKGSVNQVTEAVMRAVSDSRPVIVHTETLTADRSTWKMGVPYSELNLEIEDVIGVTVDGLPRSATVSGGIVTIVGDPVRAGSSLSIAVSVVVKGTFRRVAGVRVTAATPLWVFDNVLTSGGLSGRANKVSVGNYEVDARRVELRISVNGVATRLADAFSLRDALQSVFNGGLSIRFPSSRGVYATINGLVEVLETTALGNLPSANGIIQIPFMEYVAASQVRDSRSGGAPVRTTVTLDVGDDQYTVDTDDIFDC